LNPTDVLGHDGVKRSWSFLNSATMKSENARGRLRGASRGEHDAYDGFAHLPIGEDADQRAVLKLLETAEMHRRHDAEAGDRRLRRAVGAVQNELTFDTD
jgi:hypothetical protein